MAYHFRLSANLTGSEWIGIFIRGLWMDLSMTGYILAVTGLFLSIFFFAGAKTHRIFFNIFTLVLLFVFSFILVTDLELYRNWGFRIDGTPLLYLKTPDEAMASVKIGLSILLVLLTLAIIIFSYKIYRKLVLSDKNQISVGKWWMSPILLLITATMIIPVRGGFGIAPMNPGKVFFSQNIFANHSALNGIWNLIYGLTKSGHMYRHYPNRVSEETANEWNSILFHQAGEPEKLLNTERPNVVILLLESFTSKLIEPIGGQANITPNFNKLCSEGLLFSNIFASGDRSDKGIVAVLSGFPAQSTQSIIKFPLKSAKLPTISEAFDSIGYHTAFYYGGDPDFANIRSYLFSAKFRRIVSQDDFPRSFRNSQWGVHDERLFSYFLEDLDSAKTPFFKFLFTLSSHEPFEIPAKPKFPKNDDGSRFLSSIHYTDSCLGRFFDVAKTKSWYANTLFILIADHGHRLPENNPIYASERFSIPMLWLGGALNKTGVVDGTASQNDLAKTLLNQFNIKADKFLFSKDLLAENNSFAYYVFNDGFGFVTDSTKLIWDHVGEKAIVEPADSLTQQAAFSFFRKYQEYFLGL